MAADVVAGAVLAQAIDTAEAVHERRGDYRVSLTLRSINAGDIGIMLCYQDADNYYRLSWNNWYLQRSLVKRHHGVVTLLGEDTLPVESQNSARMLCSGQ